MGSYTRKTDQLTKQDWIDTMKESKWDSNYSRKFYCDFFGVEAFSDIFFADEAVSPLEGLLIRYAWEDFYKKKGFKIIKVTNVSSDGEYKASYSNVEHAPNKLRNCFSNGLILFEDKKGNRYVYSIVPYPSTTYFGIASARSTKPSGLNILNELMEYARTHNFFKKAKIDADAKFITFDRPYTWDDLIVPDTTKNDIRRNLKNLLESVDVYKKNDIPLKRGLIFSGQPGTGKSLLGKILCHNIDWTFLWITPRHFQDVCDVHKIMKMARLLAPTILFLEDLDLYGSQRENNSKSTALGELMNQLDGIEENDGIITIATTNNPGVLEKALLDRPGRFDKVIEMKKPIPECRMEMLQNFTASLKNKPQLNLELLVRRTEDMTGAQIRELVNMAILFAVDAKSYDKNKILKLKQEHFEEALLAVGKKDFSKHVGFVRDDEDVPTDAPCAEQPSLGQCD